MENASKALIIAGAILLAILIISLGIMVYNQAKSTVSDANLTSTEVSTFNSQLEDYCGSGLTADRVVAMVAFVQSVNAAEQSNGTLRFVGVTNSVTSYVTFSTASLTTGKGKTVSGPSTSATASSSYTYDITATYDTAGTYNQDAGYIYDIKIATHSST